MPPAVRCSRTMAASDAAPKAAYVYMVRCAGGQLYTGWSTDPAARLRAHRSGKGAKYTRAHGAAALAYVERCADKPAALRREYALKHLPKAQKETLCAAWAAAGRPGEKLTDVCYNIKGETADVL